MDVTDRRKRGVFRFGLVFGLSVGGLVVFLVWMGLFGLATSAGGKVGMALFLALTALGLIAAAGAAAKRRSLLRAETEDLVSQVDLTDLRQAVAESFQSVSLRFSTDYLRSLVNELVACKRFGTTIRVCLATDAAAIDPIAVPFEPQEISRANKEWFTGNPRDPRAEPDGRGNTRDVKRSRSRRRRAVNWVAWLGLAWFGLMLAREIYRSFVMGHPTNMILLWMGFFAIAWIGGWLYRSYRERQFFAVPGGLVQRTSQWCSAKWNVRLFDRRHSVLLVYQAHDLPWRLFVADSDKAETFSGTEEQINAVLRAWLSPLPPPPIEQLSDLR